MTKANYSDKKHVVNILRKSFDDNKSVNYIIKQDKNRIRRITNLMAYSFEMCYSFGNVFLSEDRMGCALVLLPDTKKNLRSTLLDLSLAVSSIGLTNLRRALTRESKIKKIYPKELIYYLWFIGVEPEAQNKGIGTSLLKEVIEEGTKLNRLVCLETSTERNIPWYKKLGFTIYKELHLGYRLYFLKKE
jgi:hypothetical protein